MNNSQRKTAAYVMDYLVHNTEKVHYPVNDVRVEEIYMITTLAELHNYVSRKQGITIDCSQTCDLILNISVGHTWHHQKSDSTTATYLDLCDHYFNGASAYIAAAVIFGAYPGHHMGLVRYRGSDPLIFSHGSQNVSHYLHVSQEARYQPAPTTYCSVARIS